MKRVILFAGTTEGRRVSMFLSEHGIDVTACVATEYGRLVMQEGPHLEIRTGRLDYEGMTALLPGYDLVVDATHPYAAVVTETLQRAAAEKGIEYWRLLRPAGRSQTEWHAANMEEAVEQINHTEGAVLVTTGSKELEILQGVRNHEERLYARVLPTVEALEKCRNMGLKGSHVIAMQGPFSMELNLAMMRQLGIRYLLTKDSGKAGGVEEKLSAAEKAGVTAIIVGRPAVEKGFSEETVIKALCERYHLKEQPEEKSYFPAFIKVRGEKVLIAGAGEVAARRAGVLASFGALVTVVAPELGTSMRQLLDSGASVTWIPRKYMQEDLTHCVLAVAATDDRKVNRQMGQEAREQRIPVSVADRREEGTFYFPAVVEEDGVVAGLVSVSGREHRKIRRLAESLRNGGKR